MFKPLTLTARLTALFTLVSAAVLLGLGLLVMQATSRHFVELDRIYLEDQVRLIQKIVSEASSRTELTRRLDEAQSSHAGLFLHIRLDGQTVYGTPDLVFPDLPPANRAGDRPLDWQDGSRRLRGLSREIAAASAMALPGRSGALMRLSLALDTAQHAHFQDELGHTLALYLLLATVIGGVLAWWAARRGLAPLRIMQERARAVSAQHLEPRMPEQAVPVELADLARSLNTMLDRLQQDFRRLMDFSSDLAHELRTPISNLLTQTQVTLTQPRDAAAYRDILASNAEEFQRLARMVSDMLFLAKADNDLLVPHREPVDLAAEARALAEFYDVLVEEKGLTLHCAGQATVAGDRLMLRRALSNLLSNAIRHTPSGGRITVHIDHASDATVKLSVENIGDPIPAEHLPRLFDRFYRVDASRQRFGDGTGLGLSIVNSIIKAHHGTIRADSAHGLTRFDITLPMP